MNNNNRSAGMRDPDGKKGIKTGSRFTNTAVPRFDGGGCWQQHLQIVQAIVKSNGWSEGTAALQLFTHLDGEALNVARGGKGKMGGSIKWSFGVLQLSRETSCVPAAIREHESLRIGSRARMLILGKSDVSGRSCRSSWHVREWTREF